MNERIIELADKAVEDISSGPWNIPDEFCKKFAELIVKECCDIVHSKTDESIRVVMAIEQHFGVEQ